MRLLYWPAWDCWLLLDERRKLVTAGSKAYVQAVRDGAPASAVQSAAEGKEYVR